MQYDTDKHVIENARLWKDKNDDLKKGNLELKAKYEKLKAQYVKEHDELKTIKDMRGPSSSFGSFKNYSAFGFLFESPLKSASVPKVKREYVKEEVDENTN